MSDTGCGIPADKREWVFGRFCKVNEFVAGAGLGLSICQEIVGKLGGSIRVNPDYTPGCSIDVVLP